MNAVAPPWPPDVRYVVRALSYRPQQPDVALEFLALPFVARTVFPALLTVDPSAEQEQVEVVVRSVADVDLDLLNHIPTALPDERPGRWFYTRLQGVDGGAVFSCSLYAETEVFPSSASLVLRSDALARHGTTVADLEQLVVEFAAALGAFQATVYDRQESRERLRPLRMVRVPSYRSYPATVHWITYLGRELLDLVPDGVRPPASAARWYRREPGLVVVTQDSPVIAIDPAYVDRATRVERELGLSDLKSWRRPPGSPWVRPPEVR